MRLLREANEIYFATVELFSILLFVFSLKRGIRWDINNKSILVNIPTVKVMLILMYFGILEIFYKTFVFFKYI